MLFTAFSVSVSAEESNNSYGVVQESWVQLADGTQHYFIGSDTLNGMHGFEPFNNIVEKQEANLNGLTYVQLKNNAYFYNRFYIVNNGQVLLEKDKNYTLNISNIYHSLLAFASSTTYVRKVSVVSVAAIGFDGNYQYFNVSNLQNKQPLVDFSASITPIRNVEQIEVVVKSSISDYIPNSSGTIALKTYWGEFNGDNGFQINLNEESQESGLLKTVIEWLKGIKNGITEMFNSIAELPSKLWTAIENGLKNLFIPDEQFMTDYSDNWDNLLSQRFGAIYDVSQIMFDFVGNIQVSDATNTIRFPEVSLDFSGSKFTFGGVDVKIVPDNFEVLVNACKLIISVICTFLFINGLRKRYDEVMGVEQ